MSTNSVMSEKEYHVLEMELIKNSELMFLRLGFEPREAFIAACGRHNRNDLCVNQVEEALAENTRIKYEVEKMEEQEKDTSVIEEDEKQQVVLDKQ